MKDKKKPEVPLILYVKKDIDKTEVYRVSEKGALKLIRKGLKKEGKQNANI